MYQSVFLFVLMALFLTDFCLCLLRTQQTIQQIFMKLFFFSCFNSIIRIFVVFVFTTLSFEKKEKNQVRSKVFDKFAIFPIQGIFQGFCRWGLIGNLKNRMIFLCFLRQQQKKGTIKITSFFVIIISFVLKIAIFVCMFLAQKKRALGGHALIKHCSRGRGRFWVYGKGGKKYYRLQTNGEGGNGFKLWPLKIINTALFIKCCMVIVYKKVITAFLNSYILLTKSNTTNFQNHEIQIFTILF